MRVVALCVTYFFCTLTAPLVAQASVVISEVAWMGTSRDANDEWIELYNDGPTTSLTGWTLKALDGQPSIILSGSMPSNSYILLERTDDDTVPTATALVVYTGAMGNAGEVLELRDENGTLVDSVQGSGDWVIGGNNETKDTLQRFGEPATGAWMTFTPTPLSGTVERLTEESEDGAQSTSTVRTSTNLGSGGDILDATRSKVERVAHLSPGLQLDMEEERTVVVGVESIFSVHTYSEGGREIVVHDIDWNFGDGTTAHGREVRHTFSYVGEYIVYVSGRRSGFLKEVTGSTQIIVHVVEPGVEIVHADTTHVELKNKNQSTIDVSGLLLVSGSGRFEIPQGTYVLPNTSIRFPSRVTGLHTSEVHLVRTDGSVVSSYPSLPVRVSKAIVPSVPRDIPLSTSTVEPEDVTQQKSDFPQVLSANVAEAFDGATNTGQEKGGKNVWWFLGLAATIAVSVLAVILVRRERREVIEGFIIEDE